MNTMVCGGLLSLMLVAGFTAYGYQVSSMSSMASALTADLQCDTSWVQGAASAVISKTRTPWLSKRHRGAPVTTTEATFMAPFDGLHTYAIPQNEGADYEFGLVFKDASDNPIGEPMTACYSKSCTFGLSLTIR